MMNNLTKALIFLCISLFIGIGVISNLYVNKVEEFGKLEKSYDTVLDANKQYQEKEIKDSKADRMKDEILSDAFKSQDELQTKFELIKKKFNNSKCPVHRGVKNEISTDISAELSAVRVLLDEAACLANRDTDCKPPERADRAL